MKTIGVMSKFLRRTSGECLARGTADQTPPVLKTVKVQWHFLCPKQANQWAQEREPEG